MFPTAIGTEPENPDLDSSGHWRRTMQGHAAANMVPVVASNRVGLETGKRHEITFYGSSFIAGHTGDILAGAGRKNAGYITAMIDLDASANYRETWGVFRDRRPSQYGAMMTLDGKL